MNKIRCKLCGTEFEAELNKDTVCPNCNAIRKDLVDFTVDKSIWVVDHNPSIVMIKDKCINCGLCKNTCENIVGIKYDREKVNEPICINCGQCVLACPTGALVPKYDYKKVIEYINNPDYTVVVSTAPAVRVALGDDFKLEPGQLVTGKMVSALKQVGFDYVFDTSFGADLTITEEAYELVDKILNKKKLPQFTSCCPSWVKYCEIYHDDLLDYISTIKSPISIQGTIIKNYFAKIKNIDSNKIINVTIAPCTAKKYEIKRPELGNNDFILTTSELSLLLQELNVDFSNLEDTQYDEVLGEATGAGIIFGNSGGVMEAALRTAYYYLTGNRAPEQLLDLQPVRGLDNIKEATLKINDNIYKVAVVYGMPALENILPKKDEYTFIEVMNCPGGCIGGGGQPKIPQNKINEYREKRINTLYNIDKQSKKHCSYENKELIKLYKEYLDKPGSEKAVKELHTKYQSKKDMLNK